MSRSPTSPSSSLPRVEPSNDDAAGSVTRSASLEQKRPARPVKPLGSARRPTRSRTPTPNNPHPQPSTSAATASIASSPRFATTSRPEGSSTLLLGGLPLHSPFVVSSETGGFRSNRPQADFAGRLSRRSISSSSGDPSSSSSSSAFPSGAVSAAKVERRPWFPYPSNAGSFSSTQRSLSSHGAADKEDGHRRPSTQSNESGTSSLSSSASSYNSDDLSSLAARRRAFSAEPEDWSQAVARGRRLSRMPIDSIYAHAEVGDDETNDTEQTVGSGSVHSSSDDDEKERAHFQSVMKAFDSYLSYSLAANNARRRSYYSLPRAHRLLLSSLGSALPGPLLKDAEAREQSAAISGGRGFKARLDEIDDRIRRNADVLAQIVADSRGFLGDETEDEKETIDDADKDTTIPVSASHHSHHSSAADGTSDREKDASVKEKTTSSSSENEQMRKRVAYQDVDKVRSTIKQFVRDWSAIGAVEREAAYDPILEALEARFAHVSSAQRSRIRVLVPGAGLGRLAYEVAWLGFSCQGNEFSFYMLLASHFILNKTTCINEHVVYPFIHSSSNWRTANDMLLPVRIPDINPSDLPSHVDFSMVAGEFIEVYSKKQERAAWDAIATCFFIDTARNFARYVEVINHVLPVGGVWINVGPLLWHYEGSASHGGDVSVELTLEEVMGLIELMGFAIEKRCTLNSQPYTGNAHSMLSYEYAPEFWQARKVRDVDPAPNI